jgi:hypothetical protein
VSSYIGRILFTVVWVHSDDHGSWATQGGEPAIRHEKHGPLQFNGTNFFLMREAIKRNRNITLYGLSWSFPGWFAARNALSTDQAEYSADWVDGVRQLGHTGRVVMSVWNEQNPKPATAEYAKLLRATLDRRGHADVLVMWPDSCCDDGDWDAIAQMVTADPALARAVDWIGSHYPTESRTCPASALAPDHPADYRSTCAQRGLAAHIRQPLVDSEAWGAGGVEGDLVGGATMARILNWEPLVGRISATVVWQILWGSYDGIGWANNSLIRAASPWSGAFEVLPAGYAVAHHTRFSQAGWHYLEDGKGCGWLAHGGSYVTRVAPNGKDWSIVLETMAPDVSCDCDTCGNKQRSAPVRSWSVASSQIVSLRVVGPHCGGRLLTRFESQPFSDPPRLFKSMPPLRMGTDCMLRLTLPINTQLTLSTLPHSSLAPVPPSPPESQFPLPWRADFSGPSGGASAMPSYFQDLNGAFQLAPAFDHDGDRGPVMEQVARYVPIMWFGTYAQAKMPLTIFGDSQTWANVSVSATVALVDPPIVDPFGWNSSYGDVQPQADSHRMTGREACEARGGPPLDCAWANTSATVAVRVGAGAPSWVKTGFGYFFTVAVTGEWRLEAALAARAPPPPFPREPCPSDFKPHVPNGFWHNLSPPGTTGDKANATVPLCAKKCAVLDNCRAFEVYDAPEPACYVFLNELAEPFTMQEECITCVKKLFREEDAKEDAAATPAARAIQANADTRERGGVRVRILARGHVDGGFGFKRWHNISLLAAGCRLRAVVDGAFVADVTDTGCDQQPGWGAVGSGWHAAQFKEVTAATTSS